MNFTQPEILNFPFAKASMRWVLKKFTKGFVNIHIYSLNIDLEIILDEKSIFCQFHIIIVQIYFECLLVQKYVSINQITNELRHAYRPSPSAYSFTISVTLFSTIKDCRTKLVFVSASDPSI